jgi:hypothetical protein
MSFFKNLFRKGEPKGEPFIATPTQSIPGLEPIAVQAIENLYPDVEDQKQAFQWALNYKKEMKRDDTKGLLAMLAYSEGEIKKLPGPSLWLDGHFRGEMIDPIFPKMKDAEEWVKSTTKTQI